MSEEPIKTVHVNSAVLDPTVGILYFYGAYAGAVARMSMDKAADIAPTHYAEPAPTTTMVGEPVTVYWDCNTPLSVMKCFEGCLMLNGQHMKRGEDIGGEPITLVHDCPQQKAAERLIASAVKRMEKRKLEISVDLAKDRTARFLALQPSVGDYEEERWIASVGVGETAVEYLLTENYPHWTVQGLRESLTACGIKIRKVIVKIQEKEGP